MLARVPAAPSLRRARLAPLMMSALLALLAGCELFGVDVATENLTSPCPDGSEASSRTLGVSQSQVNIRVGPGTGFDRVIDHPRSRERNAVEYAVLRPGVTVLEECRKDGWSRIWVTEPVRLRATHHGWVATRLLSQTSASADKPQSARRG